MIADFVKIIMMIFQYATERKKQEGLVVKNFWKREWIRK